MEFNRKTLDELFTSAYKRIMVEETEKYDVSDLNKSNSELIANAIMNLVKEVLENADYSTGIVKLSKENRKYLGRLGTGTMMTSGSKYELDRDGLRIVLDYSNEERLPGIVFRGHGRNFLHKTSDNRLLDKYGREVSLADVNSILSEYGVTMQYTSSLKSCLGALIEVEQYEIYVPRRKEKEEDFKTYIKKH